MGTELVSPEMQAEFLTTGPPGKPSFNCRFNLSPGSCDRGPGLFRWFTVATFRLPCSGHPGLSAACLPAVGCGLLQHLFTPNPPPHLFYQVEPPVHNPPPSRSRAFCSFHFPNEMRDSSDIFAGETGWQGFFLAVPACQSAPLPTHICALILSNSPFPHFT